jgi:hypothetical protein
MTPSGSEHTTSCRQVKHLVNIGSQKKSTVAELRRSDLSRIPQIVVGGGDDDAPWSFGPGPMKRLRRTHLGVAMMSMWSMPLRE